MNKLLLYLTALGVASLVVSGITKSDEHGLLGVVSNASWAGALGCAAAIVAVGTATLVGRARS